MLIYTIMRKYNILIMIIKKVKEQVIYWQTNYTKKINTSLIIWSFSIMVFLIWRFAEILWNLLNNNNWKNNDTAEKLHVAQVATNKDLVSGTHFFFLLE